MVSDGQIKSDSGNLSSIFANYDSLIGELDGSWSGSSHDNLVNKARDFSSQFLSSIKNQMSSFADACNLYGQYVDVKENLLISKNNYNRAVYAKDNRNISSFSNQINLYNNKLINLKSQIEAYLNNVCSVKLEASNIKFSLSSSSVNKRIQSAMDWAIAIAADDTHGYSQQTRYGNPNYDCSSLVIDAYEAAGIPVKEAGAGYTGNMRQAFTKVGFEWIPGNPSIEDLEPGDILLREKTHTEMYIGNGLNVAAHGDMDGVNGDSSGREICVSEYYGPWEGVLRYVGEDS